jgi:long-chain acyl-CoA synthetase
MGLRMDHSLDIGEIEACPNLVALFLARADAKGDAPFLWAKENGAWVSVSWAQVARQVVLLAQGLVRLGLAPGDRVLLVCENRPEWCVADLAIMAAGGITVPAYTTNTERDHAHVLENSGARMVVVSGAKLAKPLLPAALRSGVVAHVIAMEPLGMAQAGAIRPVSSIPAGPGVRRVGCASIMALCCTIAPGRPVWWTRILAWRTSGFCPFCR